MSKKNKEPQAQLKETWVELAVRAALCASFTSHPYTSTWSPAAGKLGFYLQRNPDAGFAYTGLLFVAERWVAFLKYDI